MKQAKNLFPGFMTFILALLVYLIVIIIEGTPEKDFITYGVGVPMMQMRDPEPARGRVPVNGRVEETTKV